MVTASRVRYIKLGQGGIWESECFEKGIIRLGFRTETHFDICKNGDWEALTEKFHASGRTKGVATNFSNQVKAFFEDDGILWITFSHNKLRWAFADKDEPIACHHDKDGTFRKVKIRWNDSDINDKPLHMDDISGRITRLAAFRGASSEIRDKEDIEYIIRRINGMRFQAAGEAKELCHALCGKIVLMMRKLTPKDFELLVDLVFSGSGWRRQSVVGETQKTVDMVLQLPTTGERAFVQVKSSANQTNFNEEYLEAFQNMKQFGRMFFVYHTVDGKENPPREISCADPSVTIIGPEKFAQMVLDAGLTSWLINRVS
ncbi:conserved hypothetical protein [Rhodospirillaceae bacterium LM-1]|nr:conserved hypothetical protein [Rhodospirillaceae bacterium LM-1]